MGETLGFILSLHTLSGGDITKENEILGMSVYQVYTKLQVLNQLAAAERAHVKALNRKK